MMIHHLERTLTPVVATVLVRLICAVAVCMSYKLACFLKLALLESNNLKMRGSLDSLGKSDPLSNKNLLTPSHIDTIASRRWKEVLAWIVFHPDELLFLDKKSQTVLHHACLFRAPAQVIAMILFQAPELASMANADDEIPLHWAVRLSAPHEVIQCLLSAHPVSACGVKDKDGASALSLLWERHDAELLQLWWASGREAVLAHAGWKGILYFLQCFSFSFVRDAADGDDDTAEAMISHGDDFLPLHTATRCEMCPPLMYPLFLQVHKDETPKQDELGRTPLAVACLDPVGNRSVGALSKVHLLLAAYPEAASVEDYFGRIPLHTALESGLRWEEGIDCLVSVSPQYLQLIDPVTRLPPFLLAATASRTSPRTNEGYESRICRNEGETQYLSTVFSLLRADPSQLTHLLK
jgi:hypothetical protein